MNKVKRNYIVYIAYYKGDPMYIGQGVPDRYKHITSGVSHCYEANKHYFFIGGLDVKIFRKGLTREASIKLEDKLITKLKPQWNRRNRTLERTTQINKDIKKIFKVYVKNPSGVVKRQIKFIKIIATNLNIKSLDCTIDPKLIYALMDDSRGIFSRLVSEDICYYKKIRLIFKIVKLGDSMYYIKYKPLDPKMTHYQVQELLKSEEAFNEHMETHFL